MENQVTSLELSKRLKALGVKQESEFYWVKAENDAFFHLSRWKNQKEFDDDGDEVFDELGISSYLEIDVETAVEFYSAFLASELGEMFWKITNKNVGKSLFIKAYGEVFGFKGTGCVGDVGVMNLLREPDRLALMLEYLIQNKMI